MNISISIETDGSPKSIGIIRQQQINETPVAIIDVETTGLYHHDRICELSIVRVDPGGAPVTVMDTLINPKRMIKNSDIHGITDEDVRDAPTFADVSAHVHNCLQGCVVAAHNAYFDMRYIRNALAGVGMPHFDLPYFCLMYMRPLLGLGPKAGLQQACEALSLEFEEQHHSCADAEAAAACWVKYRSVIAEQGLTTWDDVAKKRRYKFAESFDLSTISTPLHTVKIDMKSRQPSVADESLTRIRRYWSTLKPMLSDLQIDAEELQEAKQVRSGLAMTKEEIRSVHARLFAAAIVQFADDNFVDDDEVRKLQRLHKCLRVLGWAPGQ